MSYILNIQNFQSIQSLSLPVKGFTALVGKSNRGKSAIIRALRAILLNEWSAGYVRAGEKETLISFEIKEKTPYLLALFPNLDIRKIFLSKPLNEYQILLEDGSTLKYPKVGKGTPEKFEELNLANIVTERDDTYNLNFQGQLDPLFLITNTEVELTSFINKIFDISRFEKALREMKSDDIKIARELSSAENEIPLLETKKQEVEKQIAGTARKAAILLDCIHDAELLSSLSNAVEQDLIRYQELLDAKRVLEDKDLFLGLQKILEGLLTQTLQQGEETLAAKRLYERRESSQASIENLNSLLEVPKNLLVSYTEQESICQSLFEIKRFTTLSTECIALSQTKDALSQYTLGITESLTQVSDLQGCFQDFARLSSIQKQIQEGTSAIEPVKEKVSGLDTLKETLFSNIDVCPVCEQKICTGIQK